MRLLGCVIVDDGRLDPADRDDLIPTSWDSHLEVRGAPTDDPEGSNIWGGQGRLDAPLPDEDERASL